MQFTFSSDALYFWPCASLILIAGIIPLRGVELSGTIQTSDATAIAARVTHFTTDLVFFYEARSDINGNYTFTSSS
jgi:hypothetical protein